ncbi:M42 glutamyl aminopeptidase superfamily domain protein [Mycobacterium avium subsp. avium 2285 (R)]|nr:M42 glutamyl aminopeptidase superfamily domain protein [Mycobacterium avium subsp. avium 2285 (R)]
MAHRDRDSTDELLQELLWTYGPCGQEDAVRAVIARELEPIVDDLWTDDAGNLIGYIAADASRGDAGRPTTGTGPRRSPAPPPGSWPTWTSCP